MLNKLSIVYPYYKSSNIISKKFEEWLSYDEVVKQNIEIIIIDDGSPDGESFIDHWQETSLDIKLFKITEDFAWNECGANNLGFSLASYDWVLRCDIDWYIPSDTLRYFIENELQQKSYYIFPAKYVHNKEDIPSAYNIYVIERETFWEIGGYDEECRGHYGSDLTFRHRLDRAFAVKQIYLNNYHIEAYLGASDQHGLIRNADFCRNLLEYKIANDQLMPKNYFNFKWERLK